jgi:hypothetical protein
VVLAARRTVPFSPQTGLVYVSGLNVPSKISVPKSSRPTKAGSTSREPPVFPTLDEEVPARGHRHIHRDRHQQRQGPLAEEGAAPDGRGRHDNRRRARVVGVSGKGVLRALDPKTGKLFLQHPLGARVDDAASVYSINAKEHVLIATGGSAVPYGGLAGSRATFTVSALNK